MVDTSPHAGDGHPHAATLRAEAPRWGWQIEDIAALGVSAATLWAKRAGQSLPAFLQAAEHRTSRISPRLLREQRRWMESADVTTIGSYLPATLRDARVTQKFGEELSRLNHRGGGNGRARNTTSRHGRLHPL